MTAAACDPPEYDAEADFLQRTPRHFLDPDPQDSTSCKVCGAADGYGVLHLTEPDPEPDNSAWQVGDIVRNPKTGGIFAVRSNYGRLEFLELYPTAAQDHAPVDAELLVRDGKACCRCLGCAS